MSKVYEDAPNIVKIQGSDKSGTFERHIVGFTLDEVIEAITLSLDGAEQTAKVPTKSHRKARRTKAEMQAATPQPERKEETATAGKTWPE